MVKFLSLCLKFLFFFLNIYLVALGLSCSTQDFQSSLQHVESFSSVQFSCSVMFDSLRPHELQHARPPESPLDCKEIQPVHPKGDQCWVFFGRNDAKAETPVLCPSHAKSWLIGKDSDAGKDWEQEEKRTTEDEMAGWHHRLDGRESEWTPGRWWWTGRPGMLQFMQRVRHDWATEMNWTELNWTELRLVITFLPRSKRLLISWLKSPSAVILEPPKLKAASCPVPGNLSA